MSASAHLSVGFPLSEALVLVQCARSNCPRPGSQFRLALNFFALTWGLFRGIVAAFQGHGHPNCTFGLLWGHFVRAERGGRERGRVVWRKGMGVLASGTHHDNSTHANTSPTHRYVEFAKVLGWPKSARVEKGR